MKVVLFYCSIFAVIYASSPENKCHMPNPQVWQNAVCCRNTCPKNWTRLPLLLVSMDGFRADYLQRDKTPAIQSLIDCGTHAPFMYPSYPSKTFPNHYTIVTGLYPESHGIIDNTMYDPTVEPPQDRLFLRPEPSAKNPQWWHGEPIWNTVTKNGMKSATYFWPGTEAKIQGMSPTYFYNYNATIPFYKRVDQVIQWLLLDDSERPDFLTVYFDEPDHTGHGFGPDSMQVTNELVIVDAFINYLMRKIFDNGLLHCVNMILLADHGMQLLVRDYMKLTDYVPNTNGMMVYAGPIGRIMLENSSTTVDDVLNSLMCKYKNARVFKTEEVPTRFHYTQSRNRIGDIVIELDPGHTFFRSKSWNENFTERGDHGFDYKTDSMHALFLAYGPKFKQNYTVKPFQNVELYNLFADTLDIPVSQRASTNGTLGRLHEIFVDPPSHPQSSNVQIIDYCEFHEKPLKQCGYCVEQNANSCQKIAQEKFVQGADTQCIGYCVTPLCQSAQCGVNLVYWPFFNTAIFAKYELNKESLPLRKEDLMCSYVAQGIDECPNLFHYGRTQNPEDISFYSLDSFNNDAWAWLQNLTFTYAKQCDHLIVMNGAIFDYDSNGLADPVEIIQKKNTNSFITIPSHYYQILLHCDNGTWTSTGNMCDGTLKVVSFILPHVSKNSNCLTPEKYLTLNTGRVRDIELLTNLEFFPDMDFSISVRLRTQINEKLW